MIEISRDDRIIVIIKDDAEFSAISEAMKIRELCIDNGLLSNIIMKDASLFSLVKSNVRATINVIIIIGDITNDEMRLLSKTVKSSSYKIIIRSGIILSNKNRTEEHNEQTFDAEIKAYKLIDES